MSLNKRENRKAKRLLFFVSGWAFFFLCFSYSIAAENKNIKIESSIHDITLQWTVPVLNETQGLAIIRQVDRCPKTFNDGEIIYRGNGSNFTDNEIKKDTNYCYGLFLYDSLGSALFLEESGLVQLKTIGEYAQILWEENVFIGIGIILIIILSVLNIIKSRKMSKARA